MAAAYFCKLFKLKKKYRGKACPGRVRQISMSMGHHDLRFCYWRPAQGAWEVTESGREGRFPGHFD